MLRRAAGGERIGRAAAPLACTTPCTRQRSGLTVRTNWRRSHSSRLASACRPVPLTEAADTAQASSAAKRGAHSLCVRRGGTACRSARRRSHTSHPPPRRVTHRTSERHQSEHGRTESTARQSAARQRFSPLSRPLYPCTPRAHSPSEHRATRGQLVSPPALASGAALCRTCTLPVAHLPQSTGPHRHARTESVVTQSVDCCTRSDAPHKHSRPPLPLVRSPAASQSAATSQQ